MTCCLCLEDIYSDDEFVVKRLKMQAKRGFAKYQKDNNYKIL